MLPHLEPNDALAGRTVRVPPPLRFRPLRGLPHTVTIRRKKYQKAEGLTAAQIAGLGYEQKVQAELQATFRLDYEVAPSLCFYDDSGSRTVIPDGLLCFPHRTLVIEIKLQHMPEAWWQLDQLYRPVVEARIRVRPVSCVEIVRSYDPSMPFPCPFDLIEKVEDLRSYTGKFGVLPWKL